MRFEEGPCPDLKSSVERLEGIINNVVSSGLDLSEVMPSRDSLVYRLQIELKLSCSNVLIRFIDTYGTRVDHIKPDELKYVLDLLYEAKKMFGEPKSPNNNQGEVAFIVNVVSRSSPDLVPEEYCYLRA